MADLDISELIARMVTAARDEASDLWPSIAGHVEAEATALAGTLSSINARRLSGQLNEHDAQLEFRMARNSADAWIRSLEGAAQLKAESVINVALLAVKDYVQEALGGWVIFPG